MQPDEVTGDLLDGRRRRTQVVAGDEAGSTLGDIDVVQHTDTLPAVELDADTDVVVPCVDLDASVTFLESQGYRLELIVPADEPAIAVVAGHGVRLRLDTTAGRWEGISTAPAAAPTFELTRRSDSGNVVVGRAGMHYRDLLPARQGGRVIASHIVIPEGGPVPDYVHHHGVRFQAIYCRRGWVRVVYEDQGPPFTLREGDCVLQPPHIRHRVLQSSPGLEVVEITSPAVHVTHVEHDRELPTQERRADREFEGQRFVRHEAERAPWKPWREDGFIARETGIGAATGGVAGVRVVRPTTHGAETHETRHDGELLFWFVTRGTATLRIDGRVEELGSDDAVAIPAGSEHALVDCSTELELLEVTVPDQPVFSSS